MSQNICFHCGSVLEEIKKVVSNTNQQFPLTITTFKCPNKPCQDATDEKQALALKKIKDQEQIKKSRAAKKAEEQAQKKLAI